MPETLGLGLGLGLCQHSSFYAQTGAYRDMVVTHLFQILAFTAMEPPTVPDFWALVTTTPVGLCENAHSGH